MRYLSIIFASLLLVGCAQTTDVETESDMQSQSETSDSTEVESTPETEQVEPEDLSEEADQPKPTEEETESESVEMEDSGSESEESETSETESSQTEAEESESAETEGNESESETETTEPEEETTEEEPAEEEASEEAEPAGYTMAMVSENDDANSCWSVINGNVYDLTEWAVPGNHPGGSSNILSLCGRDGSDSFNARHGGQSNPESTLQSYLLGPLS